MEYSSNFTTVNPLPISSQGPMDSELRRGSFQSLPKFGPNPLLPMAIFRMSM